MQSSGLKMNNHFPDNPSPEFLRFGPRINVIIGYHEYEISDYGKDGKTYWFLVAFFEGDFCKSIASIQLQFGEDPLILASDSIENIRLGIDLDELYLEIMLGIKQFLVIHESIFHDVSLEFLKDNFLMYSLQIEPLKVQNLAKLVDVDEVMTHIKEIILSYDLK